MTIVAEGTELAIPAGTWSIDPTWSAVEFEIKKVGLALIKGRALGFEGAVVGGDELKIEGEVDVAGLTTFDEQRDGHLGTPDFFDAERHPRVRFESTSVDQQGDELVVRGDLTLKGTTHPVELRGRYLGIGLDPMGNERIALELEGVIDRTKYGVNWNAPVPGGDLMLPNEVTLRATLAAVRAA